ncbi:cytochrome P450 [Nonomuraea sediminis]|uniref:cytochrome P450 n=1 Tax=Nonomuraea sediminis TaxID=2835864 RepID=UPI001BDBF605|nr:cytochrome P450 [Nonomuraea sediminis]
MTDLPVIPFDRSDPLDVPAAYRELRHKERIARVRTRAGDEVWLVSGYEDARALFADGRMGRSHPKPEEAARISGSALLGGPQGDFETEKADHERMRKLFVRSFSARRMKALSEHVGGLVDGLLDELTTRTPPVDLHKEFSFPLPVYVICELLGVPFDDRDYFSEVSTRMGSMDEAVGMAAREEMGRYMARLIDAKRHDPGEDVLSDLVDVVDDDGTIAQLAGGLLFAGHETTVNRIDYGVLLLLHFPEQLAMLKADPGLAPAAVEEILRMGSPGLHGIPRYAREDVEIAGVTIKAGEAVVLTTNAANRDETAFDHPDLFDLHRSQDNPHLGFGHGAHFCVGASLARVELTAVFERLFQRLPDLRLAVPFEELPMNEGRLTGGLKELPVSWSTAPR